MRTCLLIWLVTLLSSISLQARSPLLERAIQAFEKNNLVQAQKFIDEAAKDAFSPEQVWYYRGVIYEGLLRKQITSKEAPGLLKEALLAYRKVLKVIQPSSQYHSFSQINLANLWAYYLDRGRRYYRQENFKKAIEQWQHCEQIYAKKPCVTLYTAVSAHQDRQYVLAKQCYSAYVAQTATRFPAVVSRAMAYLTFEQKKNPQEALKIITTALLARPFSHELLTDQFAFYQEMKKAEILKRQLEANVIQKPNDAVCHYQLGHWYECQGALEEALQQYKEAAQLAPREVAPIRQQGVVCHKQAAQLTKSVQEMSEKEFQEQGATLSKKLTHLLKQALFHLEQAAQLQPDDVVSARYLKSIHGYSEK